MWPGVGDTRGEPGALDIRPENRSESVETGPFCPSDNSVSLSVHNHLDKWATGGAQLRAP